MNEENTNTEVVEPKQEEVPAEAYELSKEQIEGLKTQILQELNLLKSQAYDLLRTKDQIITSYNQVAEKVVATEKQYVDLDKQLTPEPVEV